MGGQHHAKAALPPGKRFGICCTEEWLILWVGLDV
jgi:hypothetical protein